MRNITLMILLLGGGHSLFAQLESDTLTIQAIRSINLPPDQFAFDVSVTSGLEARLDQVLAAAQSLGITAADLTNVSSATNNPSSLGWSFTLVVPLAKMKAAASLASLQRSIGTDNPGLALSFGVQGGQVSPELMQQSCSMKDLVADAQAQAQKIAAAAGLSAGPLISISSAGSTPQFARASIAFRSGDFTVGAIIPAERIFLYSTVLAAPNCSAEIKFKLLRYQ